MHVYQKSGNYVVICLFFKSSVVEKNSWKSKIDNTLRNSYYELPKRLRIWIFPIIICNIHKSFSENCVVPTPDNEEVQNFTASLIPNDIYYNLCIHWKFGKKFFTWKNLCVLSMLMRVPSWNYRSYWFQHDLHFLVEVNGLNSLWCFSSLWHQNKHEKSTFHPMMSNIISQNELKSQHLQSKHNF